MGAEIRAIDNIDLRKTARKIAILATFKAKRNLPKLIAIAAVTIINDIKIPLWLIITVTVSPKKINQSAKIFCLSLMSNKNPLAATNAEIINAKG
jgi:hypothetical protein